MRNAIASIGITAALTFTSLTMIAPPSSALSAPAVTVTAAAGAALPSFLPMTKRIRKGVYKPSGWNCPKNARIKGNRSSHIFHMPGQRFYKKTHPELCFTTASVARANGYRKSKV
jgi:hypothetical protein